MFTDKERKQLFRTLRDRLPNEMKEVVRRNKKDWQSNYPPDDYFIDFKRSVDRLIDRAFKNHLRDELREKLRNEIGSAVAEMEESYEPTSSTAAPTAQSKPANAGLVKLFRDIDE